MIWYILWKFCAKVAVSVLVKWSPLRFKQVLVYIIMSNKTLWECTLWHHCCGLIYECGGIVRNIFFQIFFHTNTVTFLLLCNRRLNFFTESLLGAWLWPNSIIISVINNCARWDLSSTSFIFSTTTLSLCTVNSHLLQQCNFKLTSGHSLTKLAENAQSLHRGWFMFVCVAWRY